MFDKVKALVAGMAAAMGLGSRRSGPSAHDFSMPFTDGFRRQRAEARKAALRKAEERRRAKRAARRHAFPDRPAKGFVAYAPSTREKTGQSRPSAWYDSRVPYVPVPTLLERLQRAAAEAA